MKTVMKKMFSLLLVAVLLVGVMPFAAFATENEGEDTDTTCVDCGKVHGTGVVCCSNCDQIGHDEADDHCATCHWYVGHKDGCTELCDKTANCQSSGHLDGCVSTFVCTHCNTTKEHNTETCPNYCTKCNQKGHDETDDHCSVCNYYVGHREGCTNWKCETCGQLKHDENTPCCATCKVTGHATTDPHCTHCGTGVGDHPNTCPNSSDYYTTCSKCNTRYETFKGHPECEVCESCHATADCPYCAVCWAKGDKVTTHKTAAHCEKCGNTDGTHKVTCSDYESSGNALVRIHVRLYNANTHIDTVELLTYRDDKGTQIGDSVSAHKSLIYAELADQYPDYTWGGNLYDDPGESQDYNEQIGEGTTVYINAYANQDMVLIYVHNSRSFNNLRIIQLEGKRKGDTVTKKEVTNAVSKYYNVSSLSMYSEDAWEAYVDGENVESVSSLKIPEDDSYYVIDVKISGTAKSGTSSSSTADSSNPKTGDEIFAPVAILGASASALAVLFYLNKKRAY